MIKNHICSKDFPEIIDFSRKLKESRTNLNVSKQFNNSSNFKRKLSIIDTFPEKKNILKSINDSSFSRNKPIIWELVTALFA